jgi:hypothetical protein
MKLVCEICGGELSDEHCSENCAAMNNFETNGGAGWLTGERTIKKLSICCALIVGLLGGCSTPTAKPVLASPVPAVSAPEHPSAIVSKMQAMSVASVVKSNAVIVLRWSKPADASVVRYRIYATNGTLMSVVSNIYENCTLRGFRDGDVAALYAVSEDASGMVGDDSNTVLATASSAQEMKPFQQTYARKFLWKCANGVTNILQASSNLTAWTAASRFRGTNGTAVVTLTNQTPFHRVLIQNATNVPSMTLTQQTAFETVSWSYPTPTVLEREMDATTGSFVTVKTNTGGSASAIVPYLAGAKYRVARP